MNDNTGHELVDPFDCDDNSLKGLKPQHIFALGVEWQQFRQALIRSKGQRFTVHCLKENAARLVLMAERHNRYVEDRMTKDPQTSEIWVGDYVSEPEAV